MGIALEDYPTFKTLNQRVVKPAIREINELTYFFVEIEHKRIGRKIGELKFRISQLKVLRSDEPTQETFVYSGNFIRLHSGAVDGL